MSDEKGSMPDISRAISVIMENPEIVEKISSLMKSGDEKATEAAVSEKNDSAAAPAYRESFVPDEKRLRRSQLLGALKPYVKKERADAIDSVIAIADILDMMRRR